MEKKSQGCCPSIHAKIFEIILIIGFILSIILLIVNLIISLWCFKCSYPLFIIEIYLIALNVFSIIFSIKLNSNLILRIWRSDGSVYHKNFSSSNEVAVSNIILVIINLLASIAEEVLFSFVISYLSLILDILNNNGHENENLEKKEKIFLKIMNKNYQKMFEFGGNQPENIFKKKMKMLKILPWIAINFNIFIQFLMVIFIIIIIGRINLKSDFGFAQTENNNQSVQNRMLNKKKTRRRSSGIKIVKAESDATKLKVKKKKKKKKKEKN